MTLVPPSIHPDGDQLAWVQDGGPALVNGSVLHSRVALIAAATALAIHWPNKGRRNEAALALAGGLLRSDWNISEACDFIRRVAKAAGDEEHEARGACVGTTASKLETDAPVTGLNRLASIIGKPVVENVAQWLALNKDSSEADQVQEIVEELNDRHAVISFGGSTYILNNVLDVATGQPDVTFGRASDLRLKYANRSGPDGESHVDIWLRHPLRRQYEGIEFAPPPAECHSGYYNLFKGLPVPAVSGDCSLYLAHVLENICQGNAKICEYLMSWMAHAIQRPGELPGTAVVLRGAQGVGKGVFVENFGRLFGTHYLTLFQLGQVVGRFNGHLKGRIVVHANEAVWGGNKEAEGALKGLVTDRVLPIEMKGKDIAQVLNYVRLICATNELWAVPLDLDDRRFLVLDVSAAKKENHEYFAAIEQQMNSGGLAALMHFLSNRDLTGFDVRQLPDTSMAFDLKMMSASPVEAWWYEHLLDQASFCGGKFEKSIVHKSFLDWCQQMKKPHPADLAVFCKLLQKLVPHLSTVKHAVSTFPIGKEERKSFFQFPSTEECRKHFEVLTKASAAIWEE